MSPARTRADLHTTLPVEAYIRPPPPVIGLAGVASDTVRLAMLDNAPIANALYRIEEGCVEVGVDRAR